MRKSISSPPPDLIDAQEYAYTPSGFAYSNLVKEAEGAEYGAHLFEMNHKRIKFRVAKITPTKSGQFVTLWKRAGSGEILPYDLADAVDLFVVSVRTAEHFGQFVFPKAILLEKGGSQAGEGGKRAMRVYPAWDATDSRQARNTQRWQLLYFFEMQAHMPIDALKGQQLFNAY